jgi:hypothetical protein
MARSHLPRIGFNDCSQKVVDSATGALSCNRDPSELSQNIAPNL